MPGFAKLAACTDQGVLTINSVSMHIAGAWACVNVQDLWIPTATRGNNTLIPGAAGRRANPWRKDEDRKSVRLVIAGINNVSGTPYADPWVGIETNLMYLYDNVVSPPAAPTASVAASILLPSGATITANVQPRSLVTSPLEADGLAAVLDLVIPSGGFS